MPRAFISSPSQPGGFLFISGLNTDFLALSSSLHHLCVLDLPSLCPKPPALGNCYHRVTLLAPLPHVPGLPGVAREGTRLRGLCVYRAGRYLPSPSRMPRPANPPMATGDTREYPTRVTTPGCEPGTRVGDRSDPGPRGGTGSRGWDCCGLCGVGIWGMTSNKRHRPAHGESLQGTEAPVCAKGGEMRFLGTWRNGDPGENENSPM